MRHRMGYKMDNNKKKNNIPKNKQKDKKIVDFKEVRQEPRFKENIEETAAQETNKKEDKNVSVDTGAVELSAQTQVLNTDAGTENKNKPEQPPVQTKADTKPDFDTRLEEVRKRRRKRELDKVAVVGNKVKSASSMDIKVMAVTALKVLLPVAACVLVVATVISFVNAKRDKDSSAAIMPMEQETQEAKESAEMEVTEDALEVNAHEDVNALMTAFYQALADGDIETVKTLKDSTTDIELMTYQKKSEFIESYDNITCYTKKGLEENSYFVYVSYEVKIKDIDTKGPGLIAFYVYTNEEGKMVIDGEMDENIDAALKLVTVQDDVKDLFQRVDVKYQEAVKADESLNTFLTELPQQMEIALGQELANMETQPQEDTSNADSSNADSSNTEESNSETTSDTEAGEQPAAGESQQEELPQNQAVNQIVKATSTVNVRSSDSEMADKIGRIEIGTELTRTEERINGWSKVIFEGREAYIKSDYLEVVSTQEPAADEPVQGEGDAAATKKAMATTNVNVRNAPNQEADKIGTAQAGVTYDVLEDLGEWYQINYNGQQGYVKAEFFN